MFFSLTKVRWLNSYRTFVIFLVIISGADVALGGKCPWYLFSQIEFLVAYDMKFSINCLTTQERLSMENTVMRTVSSKTIFYVLLSISLCVFVATLR